MATIEFADVCRDRPELRLVVPMPRFVAELVRRRRERQTFARLARLSDHIIRDIGFDPDAVREAAHGTWDNLDLDSWRCPRR